MVFIGKAKVKQIGRIKKSLILKCNICTFLYVGVLSNER